MGCGTANDESVRCSNSRFYGDIEICLPIIDAMTETYSNSKVKERTDLFSFDNNTILGVYLNNRDIAKIEDFDKAEIDDYFKLYALKVLEGKSIDKSQFAEIRKHSNGNISQNEWVGIKKKVLNGTKDLTIGKPTQIDFYDANDDIFTSLFLVKMINGTTERISAMTMSLVRLKNTIVYYSYYRNYLGPETLDQVRAKNDLFGYKLLEVNKND